MSTYWSYLDCYAAFVKKHAIAIDHYANVDVIGNAALTYRNQKYLEEKHGLAPVPVVHLHTKLEWLERYVGEGYDYIGIGGLVGSGSKPGAQRWLDQVFGSVCSHLPGGLPAARLHGFGVTSFRWLIRFPWFSTDSASWAKVAAYGGVLVPRKGPCGFIFTREPSVVKVTQDAPQHARAQRKRAEQGGSGLTEVDSVVLGAQKHYLKHPPRFQAQVREWLESLGLTLEAVQTNHRPRQVANLLYYEQLRKSLPEYPWPFAIKPSTSFGLRT